MSDEQKHRIIQFRLTGSEADEILEAADRDHRTISSFMRAAALDRARRILADRTAPAVPVAELQRAA